MKGRADYSKAQLSRYKHSFCKDKSYIWHSTHRISNLVEFDFGSRQAGDTGLGKPVPKWNSPVISWKCR
jgi:hypothetical protein